MPIADCRLPIKNECRLNNWQSAVSKRQQLHWRF
jgi:hypothetical protein